VEQKEQRSLIKSSSIKSNGENFPILMVRHEDGTKAVLPQGF